MTTIGMLGAGQVGSVLAAAAIAVGYDVVIANSRGPRTLEPLVRALGPRARAATAAEAAAAGDFAVLAFPWSPAAVLPAAELAGKVVLDPNNYTSWRDDPVPAITAGRITVHELRQQQVPGALLAKAFSHVQFHPRAQRRVPSDALPALLRLARPAGAPDRKALAVSSDFAEAVALATRFADELGYDTVDGGPLRESWRSGPGTPLWRHSVDGVSREEVLRDLRAATRAVR